MKFSLSFFFLLVSSISFAQLPFENFRSLGSRLADPYGICSHVQAPPMLQHADTVFATMRIAGANWLRTDFNSEAFGGLNFDPSAVDTMLVQAERRGVRTLAILPVSSPNARAWDDVDAYLSYVDKLVSHYSGRGIVWEVMNEVDLVKQPDLAYKYMSILPSVYSLIKERDPSSVVAISGVASVMYNDFFSKVADLGAFDYCDVVNFHSYSTPEELIPQYDKVNSILHKNGARLPVWLTETGYHTAKDEFSNAPFFQQIVPQSLARLGMDVANIVAGVAYDEALPYYALSDDEIQRFLVGFDEVRRVPLNEVGDLNVTDVPVLFLSQSESYPTRYFDNVVDYVRRGGTIVLAWGMPFYYDDNGTTVRKPTLGTSLLPRLHMSALLPWEPDGAALRVPGITSRAWSAPGFSCEAFEKVAPAFSPRFLGPKNLKPGDELIPVLLSGDDNFVGTIACIYKLNSDLKGNVIVSTRLDTQPWADKLREQACRVPRNFIISFAAGADRVFWYEMESADDKPYFEYFGEAHFGLLHADFSPKTAFVAYKTLTSLLPSGSSRPSLSVKDNVYLATWEQPDGTPVSAFWSPLGRKQFRLSLSPHVSVVGFLGESLEFVQSGILQLSPEVVYVVGQKCQLY